LSEPEKLKPDAPFGAQLLLHGHGSNHHFPPRNSAESSPFFTGLGNVPELAAIVGLIWIEHTYHRRRRRVALGRLTPIEFEGSAQQIVDRLTFKGTVIETGTDS
jgi:hypothetical protein